MITDLQIFNISTGSLTRLKEPEPESLLIVNTQYPVTNCKGKVHGILNNCDVGSFHGK